MEGRVQNLIFKVGSLQVGIILGGGCPGGSFPGVSYPDGNCPSGNFSGGNCPRTLKVVKGFLLCNILTERNLFLLKERAARMKRSKAWYFRE